MTTNTAASFRKTKTGEWVAFGPANIVRLGQVTIVTKSGARKTENVVRVGKSFIVAGVQCVYGYLGKAEKPAQTCKTNKGCGGCGGAVESYSGSSTYCFDCV